MSEEYRCYHVDAIREADLAGLAGLYAELASPPPSLGQMRTVFAFVSAKPEYHLLAARNGSELIGSAMAIICQQLSKDCRPFLVMENFIITSSHRRKGVGRLLLIEVERLAREFDCASVMFISSVKRPDAHAFYQRMGYRLDTARGFKKTLL